MSRPRPAWAAKSRVLDDLAQSTHRRRVELFDSDEGEVNDALSGDEVEDVDAESIESSTEQSDDDS